MKNFVQPGNIVDLAAPYAVSAGDGAQVGSIFGVAANDLANGVEGPFHRTGVFDLTALSTAVGALGAKAYWDNANKRVDTDGTVGMLIGTLSAAKGNGDTTARVILNAAAPATSEGPQAAVADADATNTGVPVNQGDATPVATVAELDAVAAQLNLALAALRTVGIIAAA